MNNRTIAAVSTPRGKGGVALIRISGENTFEIANRVFLPKSGKKLTDYKPNTVVYGCFTDGESVFDDGMAVLYKAPRSFTGEDTAELCCHGGLLVTQKLLECAVAAGSVYAGRGEFTKRAFINGKMSLTQAEAVGGIIDAVSEKHLQVSVRHMEGTLSQKINGIYNRLTMLLSSVYAYIDYPDEDMTDVSAEEMKSILSNILEELKTLYKSRYYGKAISEGISCAICGRPNTGKSSLLNLLYGSERAIVTDIEGTTRDVVTEKIAVGDAVLNISDTAGIRQSDDKIEQIGIVKSEEQIKNAELVILVLENTVKDGDRAVIDCIRKYGKQGVTIALYNKADKENSILCGEFEKEIPFSAKSGMGRQELENAVNELCGKYEISENDEIIISARQSGAIKKAIDSVSSAISSLDGFTQDIAGMELENALSALGEADGRAVGEDIVNSIFSHFCVGK